MLVQGGKPFKKTTLYDKFFGTREELWNLWSECIGSKKDKQSRSKKELRRRSTHEKKNEEIDYNEEDLALLEFGSEPRKKKKVSPGPKDSGKEPSLADYFSSPNPNSTIDSDL